MIGEQVETGLPVRADHLPGHRDEFGGAAAGAGTLGEERDAPGPADIDEAREGRPPIGRPEILVTSQRHGDLERGVVVDAREIVVTPEAGRGGTPQQMPQRALLDRGRVLMGKPPRAEPGIKVQQQCRIDHRRAGCRMVLCGKVARAVSGSSGTITYSPRRNSSAWSRKAGLPGTPSW